MARMPKVKITDDAFTELESAASAAGISPRQWLDQALRNRTWLGDPRATDLLRVWSDALDELAATVHSPSRITVLREARLLAVVGGTALIWAPDHYTQIMIESGGLRADLALVLSRLLDRPVAVAATLQPAGTLPSARFSAPATAPSPTAASPSSAVLSPASSSPAAAFPAGAGHSPAFPSRTATSSSATGLPFAFPSPTVAPSSAVVVPAEAAERRPQFGEVLALARKLAADMEALTSPPRR